MSGTGGRMGGGGKVTNVDTGKPAFIVQFHSEDDQKHFKSDSKV